MVAKQESQGPQETHPVVEAPGQKNPFQEILSGLTLQYRTLQGIPSFQREEHAIRFLEEALIDWAVEAIPKESWQTPALEQKRYLKLPTGAHIFSVDRQVHVDFLKNHLGAVEVSLETRTQAPPRRIEKMGIMRQIKLDSYLLKDNI